MAMFGKSGGGTPLLARWTSEFDCGYETQWWYVIKDTPFDINLLKSNYRYKINKGAKYFDVRIINPREFEEQLYRVQVAAFSAYPRKYRPTVDKEEFLRDIRNWSNCTIFGAFTRESGDLVGYTMITGTDTNWRELAVQKTDPEYERLQVNAALVGKVMDTYTGFLENGGIICDGARSINHETHFQDYLEKYFGFRKAYCRLHIRYNPKIAWAVEMLYPMRKIFLKLDNIGMVHLLNSVFHMEEIARNQEL